MNAIGGYFEIEISGGGHYHKNAIKLNTARNCFEYILRAKKYSKVYIPYYTCEVMLEPLRKCNVNFEFYHINELLEPVEEYELQADEAFLYTNYYGLKQNCVERLASHYGSKLIVDNAQAFYAKPLNGIDTLYSARKFFGVADGAYLYTDCKLAEELEQDRSFDRMSHLLKRADIGAEFGYSDFKTNDESLINNPIRRMSNLTERILCSVDHKSCSKRRIENYQYLDEHLRASNKIHLALSKDDVPMVYPFLSDVAGLRKRLIDNKIYVAQYWKNVLYWTTDGIEPFIVNNLVPLPIDQRYGESGMDYMVSNINGNF